MKQTFPRCLQCGENPRIMHERSEGLPTYAPLCEECYLEDLRGKPPQAGAQAGEILPKKRQNLFELFVCKSRYFSLGIAVSSAITLFVLFENGVPWVVAAHSVTVALFAPWTVCGFWLNRMKR